MVKAKSLMVAVVVCVALAVVVAAVSVSALVHAAGGKRQVTWLMSETPSVQLGVWDKLGVAGSYHVTFEVTASDGVRYLARKTVAASTDWGYVYFPRDFFHYDKDGHYYRAWIAPGQYYWVARVGGKVIASDRFRVAQSGRTTEITASP